jgi:FAD/FMN-containing dehydrogenase
MQAERTVSTGYEKNKLEIIGVLMDKLGPRCVSYAKSQIESHSFDALRFHRGYPLPEKGFPPDLVVTPRNQKQLIALLEVARRFKAPLIPRGAGTGIMGGAVALSGGIIIDFQKMSRILRVNKMDETVVLQPGAVIGQVNKVLRRSRLFLGHDPWTRDYATVGGAISTNGMGYYGGKYGGMGDQVLGLKALLADGTMIQTSAVPNSSTGFDLKRLLIGTEGTFGLIVEATLRCFPIPESETVIGFSFPSFEEAYTAALKVKSSDLNPASSAINGEGYGGPCDCYLIFAGPREITGVSVRACRRLMLSLKGKPLGKGMTAPYWSERHYVAELYENRISKNPLGSFRGEKSFDFVHLGLAPGRLVKFRKAITRLAKRRRITIEEYGTWIKPELFNFNFTRAEGVPPANLRRTVDDAMKLAIKMGGTIEYCHGAGFRLGSLMEAQHGKGFAVMKRLKRDLDPDLILNPGKLGF